MAKKAKIKIKEATSLQIPEADEKILVVCGAGKNWQEQLESISGEYDLMLVNQAGISWPSKFKFWSSWTPNYFKEHEYIREEYGFDCSYVKVSQFPQEGCLEVPVLLSGGGSGLYSVLAGLKLGYKKIIVIGINLLSNENSGYQRGWEKSFNDLDGKVKAMSGFPKKLLGEPTEKWLSDFPVN